MDVRLNNYIPWLRQIRATLRVKVGTKVRPSGRKKVSDPSCQENSRSAIHW
jgi:hypothetical protein